MTRPWIFDIKSFDDKHQHVLLPTSLITGTTHVIVDKIRDHVLTYTKRPETILNEKDDCTTIRPTIIDFISKIKKRHIDEIESDECNCGGKISIADGIAEHTVDKTMKSNFKSKTRHELDEE